MAENKRLVLKLLKEGQIVGGRRKEVILIRQVKG